MHRAPRERTTFWHTFFPWSGEPLGSDLQRHLIAKYKQHIPTCSPFFIVSPSFLNKLMEPTMVAPIATIATWSIDTQLNAINHLQLFRRESQHSLHLSDFEGWSHKQCEICAEHTISSSQGSDKSTNLAKVTGVNNVNSPLIVCEDIAILTVDSYRINLHIFKYKDAHSNWAQNALYWLLLFQATWTFMINYVLAKGIQHVSEPSWFSTSLWH